MRERCRHRRVRCKLGKNKTLAQSTNRGRVMNLRRPSLSSLLALITSVVVLALLVGVLRDQSQNENCLPLIRSLRELDPVERGEAAVELGLLRLRGERATAAVRPLIERLDDADQNVRVSAAESLL